jgi:Holliday junction resolvase
MKPEHLAPRKFRDDSANSLTGCIVQYVTLKGGFASRINSTGVFRQKLGKYTSGTQKRGIADVLATFKGLSLHIEVKHGKDSQSEAQKKIESEVKRSGGFYYLARNFSDFKIWFDNL